MLQSDENRGRLFAKNPALVSRPSDNGDDKPVLLNSAGATNEESNSLSGKQDTLLELNKDETRVVLL